MHAEKAGGVSCFVQQTHTNIDRYLVKERLFYNGKTRFSCQRIVSGNNANVAEILCRTKC